MGIYRKKPVEVEARLLTRENVTEVAMWCGGEGYEAPEGGAVVFIKTLEGTMRADLGDYVICGVQGEFYPCKPDIFEATYELVEDGAFEFEGAGTLKVDGDAVAELDAIADLWAPCELCGAVWEETSPTTHVMHHADGCPNDTRPEWARSQARKVDAHEAEAR